MQGTTAATRRGGRGCRRRGYWQKGLRQCPFPTQTRRRMTRGRGSEGLGVDAAAYSEGAAATAEVLYPQSRCHDAMARGTRRARGGLGFDCVEASVRGEAQRRRLRSMAVLGCGLTAGKSRAAAWQALSPRRPAITAHRRTCQLDVKEGAVKARCDSNRRVRSAETRALG